jgi:uncharacterized membrane protein YccC
LQRVRGLIAGLLVGGPLGIFVTVSLHATREIAGLLGFVVGLAVFAVVATGTDAHDYAADQAWRDAASDLPPVSDRIILERSQASMPGPGKQHRTTARVPRTVEATPSADTASQGAEPK